MNEGVTIAFGIIFLLVSALGLVLFKEARTHRFWRRLVAENDLDAIRGLLDGEIARWRSQRPPKGVPAAVWAGVQRMELLGAHARFVHLATAAEAELAMVDGRPAQLASALDTAVAVGARLVEMVFYDVPDYRPDVVRVDVLSTFRRAGGSVEPQPILCLVARRADALGIDWDEPPATLMRHFDASFRRTPGGEPEPITLPSPEDTMIAYAVPMPEPAPTGAEPGGAL